MISASPNESGRNRKVKISDRPEYTAIKRVEIASESDPRLDYRENLPRYRVAGIEEIWIVDPFQRQVSAETKLASDYTARTLGAGRLDSIVLPGFWIDVGWLWEDALPPTVKCLRAILG